MKQEEKNRIERKITLIIRAELFKFFNEEYSEDLSGFMGFDIIPDKHIKAYSFQSDDPDYIENFTLINQFIETEFNNIVKQLSESKNKFQPKEIKERDLFDRLCGYPIAVFRPVFLGKKYYNPYD